MNDENEESADAQNTQGSGETTKKEDIIQEPDSEIVEMEFNEDSPFYAEASEGGGGGPEKLIKKLREDLKVCQKEKAEYLNGWQKERAEFANYRKQEDDRKSVFSEAVRERILGRFLAVMDSFNMAFANKEAWEKVDENWRKGVEYIYSQMNTIFEEYGVKPVGVLEEAFDPNIHQSVELVQTDTKNLDHKVAVVIQRGYKIGERVMRPARVNVYEYREETAQ